MSGIDLIAGDMRQVLADRFPTEHFHCCVTSPPYWRQRKYKIPDASYGGFRGQLGQEDTPEEFAQHLVTCMGAVKRVLRNDGVLFLNLGDCYVKSSPSGPQGRTVQRAGRTFTADGSRKPVAAGLPDKNLIGVPWRVAFAMQADGWILRQAIVWAKGISYRVEEAFPEEWYGAVMPESVNGWRYEKHRIKVKKGIRNQTVGGNRDRQLSDSPREPSIATADQAEWKDCPGCDKCAPHGGYVLRKGAWRPISAYEMLFMFTKSPSYFCDAEAMREVNVYGERGGKCFGKQLVEEAKEAGAPARKLASSAQRCNPRGRNPRNVWALGTRPYKGVHFATFPPEPPELCIKASCPRLCCAACGAPYAPVIEGHPRQSRPTCRCVAAPAIGRVLDPFIGSGTTAVAATKLGRDCVGIDAGEEYIKMAKERLGDSGG